MLNNYDFYMKLNITPYNGEWISIHQERVISHNNNLKEVIRIFKKQYPKSIPFIAKVSNRLRI